MSDRGLRAISEVERLFREAAEQHRAEVKRRDAGAAINIADRVITSTCLQARARRDMPDQAAWARLAGELAAMAMACLQPGQWHGRPSSTIDIGLEVGHPGVMDGTLMVGRNVRRFRQERQLSLGNLARAAGLAKQTLANLENGTGNPTIETLFAVSGALGVGVTWLLAEWGTPVYVQRAGEAAWETHAGRRVRTLDKTFGTGQVNTFVIELSASEGAELPALPGGALHHVYVIRGTVAAGPSGDEATLRTGDFIRFPGDAPHAFRTVSQTATLHVVTTIPQARQFSDRAGRPLRWPSVRWPSVTLAVRYVSRPLY